MKFIANMCSIVVLICLVGALLVKVFNVTEIPYIAVSISPKGLLLFAIALQLFSVNNTLTEISKKKE
ncbi:MAG: hypothetical protein PHE61_01555 [Candidatus Omnitrophica bacterium]|nr:hypothetical protein [Candidatus Omnitrophota bacterium]